MKKLQCAIANLCILLMSSMQARPLFVILIMGSIKLFAGKYLLLILI